MIELEIDGKTVKATEGMTVIQAADAAGIYIPRFCYHEKLSIAANCRQCLVQVEKSRKPLPACATPVTPGMKVMTQSKEAIHSQSTVMQFLLINHPLDCPICDQGGECDLQDLALGYGQGYSNFKERKRAVASEDIGPLIATEMTRCIHCTRCVRFGEEIAGLMELGATGRGENMKIGTYVKHFMRSELSGNVIDICPVGALTSKPFRFKARAWEMQEWPMVAPHDCLGSSIYMHTRKQDDLTQKALMRVVPRANEAINENWISDRDRFSYEGMQDDKRLQAPMMKIQGAWQVVDWPTALHAVAKRCGALLEKSGPEALAAVASPSSTVESLYLLQKMLRSIGSPHVESRLHTQDFRDQQHSPKVPGMPMTMEALESCDQVLLIGANVSEDQPLWAHRLRQSSMDAVMQVHSIEARRYPYHIDVANRLCPEGYDLLTALMEVTAHVCQAKQHKSAKVTMDCMKDRVVRDEAKRIAEALLQATHPVLVMGLDAASHPQASQLRAWMQVLSDALHAEQIYLTPGANTAGAAYAGMLPHRGPKGEAVAQAGHDLHQLWTSHRGLFFLMHCEPEHDAVEAAAALKALQDAACVVCLHPYMSDAMAEYADFVLPITPISETDGSFINVMGHWQAFAAPSVPHAMSKPAWKVLRVLAQLLQCEGFDLDSVQAIREAMGYDAQVAVGAGVDHVDLAPGDFATAALVRDGAWPAYAVDATLRHAEALQTRLSETGLTSHCFMHPDTAKALGLQAGKDVNVQQGGAPLTLPLALDDGMALRCVRVPSGVAVAAGFGCAVAPIEIV